MLPQDVVNAVGGGIRALGPSGGLPDIASMRAEYRKNHRQETEPENPSSDWRDKARLELEKLRFL